METQAPSPVASRPRQLQTALEGSANRLPPRPKARDWLSTKKTGWIGSSRFDGPHTGPDIRFGQGAGLSPDDPTDRYQTL